MYVPSPALTSVPAIFVPLLMVEIVTTAKITIPSPRRRDALPCERRVRLGLLTPHEERWMPPLIATPRESNAMIHGPAENISASASFPIHCHPVKDLESPSDSPGTDPYGRMFARKPTPPIIRLDRAKAGLTPDGTSLVKALAAELVLLVVLLVREDVVALQ